MKRSLQLLSLLHDGHEHSGANLADALGVTRAAVWNQVRRLREEGIDILGAPGRGYRLANAFERLDGTAIQTKLAERDCADITTVDALTLTDSTNQQMLERLTSRSIHGEVLLAEYQTAGRGRHGDRWIAPPGSGLCMSLGWRFESTPPTFSGLSLVVGLAIVNSLREIGAESAGLKWPNDVIVNGRKLAGILIEMRSEAGGPCETVIGIGLNVCMSKAARDLIDQPVGDLESLLSEPVSRNELAVAVLLNLTRDLRQFSAVGFAPFKEAWGAVDVLANSPVRLELPERLVEGIARGVDEHGALLIDVAGERERFMAGHLRPA